MPAVVGVVTSPLVEQVLGGAKRVILSGKKLVLHSRPGDTFRLSQQANVSTNDETTLTEFDQTLLALARELAKETYALLNCITAALATKPTSNTGTTLQAAAKDARSNVLALVDAAKTISTSNDLTNAQYQLDVRYKNLVESVKNVVSLSQAFATM